MNLSCSFETSSLTRGAADVINWNLTLQIPYEACLFAYLHSHESYETVPKNILGTQHLFAGDIMEKRLGF